jgi:predicted DNA-binding transcriptional regulator AlpA
MIHEEYIPHIKIGHSVRFDENQIKTWLAKRSKAGRVKRRIET